MRFYLGTHALSHMERTSVPLFVSRRRLSAVVNKYPRAAGPWALDSGGFTELQLYGAWRVTPREYVDEVRRYAGEVGGLEWAAPQDWMCEPPILEGGWWLRGERVPPGTQGAAWFAGTGLSVAEHQVRTVTNYLELRTFAPDLPWVPVLQGWSISDYRRCVDLYGEAGVDLRSLPRIGIGSVCRRQHSAEIAHIVSTLAAEGLRLHAFGLKLRGLTRCADALTSCDSMAWSYDARRQPALPGCTGHKNCANCLTFALQWRERVVERVRGTNANLFTAALAA
ncbi:MAG TPA: hypothetical protein VD970_00955 [Acetobacteraceae bacterium]|nr:hypothetical protein [Acetobacteraceae bacterium]